MFSTSDTLSIIISLENQAVYVLLIENFILLKLIKFLTRVRINKRIEILNTLLTLWEKSPFTVCNLPGAVPENSLGRVKFHE